MPPRGEQTEQSHDCLAVTRFGVVAEEMRRSGTGVSCIAASSTCRPLVGHAAHRHAFPVPALDSGRPPVLLRPLPRHLKHRPVRETVRSATARPPAKQSHFRLYSRIVSVPNTAVSATDAINVHVMAPPSQVPDIIERTAVTRWLIGLAETPAWSQPGMVDGST